MTELWNESEEQFQRLVNTLWHIAEQETDGDHIQGTLVDLGDLYKWYGEVLRPQDRDLTPEDTEVSIEVAEEYGYEGVVSTLEAYEGYRIPQREQ